MNDDRLYLQDVHWVRPDEVIMMGVPSQSLSGKIIATGPVVPAAADSHPPSARESERSGFGAARGGGKTATMHAQMEAMRKSLGAQFANHDPATCWHCLNLGTQKAHRG